MNMKALRVRVSKFSVDGDGRLFGGDFDAPRATAALIRGSKEARDLDDGVAGLAVSDLHSVSPFGRPLAAR
jgi:hypothetical protein